ncbi:MAG: hypothetical protein L6R37_003343 [Teloschistes peruensis]|nr:MAG: hypothetical protein L6R37_003343 [Teloschistes peruensis]
MADGLVKNKVDLGDSLRVKESLMNTLDDLLERYLNLVHQYHAQQQSLTNDLSSGYFSLAQANFSSPNRIRYGQDFYDDRMQASITLNFDSNPERSSNPLASQGSGEATVSVSIHQSIPRSTDMRDEKLPDADTENEMEAPATDPLRWFGILVPSTLRASQSSFKKAVAEKVPSLVNISSEMKELEVEIRRTRKKIRKLG